MVYMKNVDFSGRTCESRPTLRLAVLLRWVYPARAIQYAANQAKLVA